MLHMLSITVPPVRTATDDPMVDAKGRKARHKPISLSLRKILSGVGWRLIHLPLSLHFQRLREVQDGGGGSSRHDRYSPSITSEPSCTARSVVEEVLGIQIFLPGVYVDKRANPPHGLQRHRPGYRRNKQHTKWYFNNSIVGCRGGERHLTRRVAPQAVSTAPR